MVSHGAIVYWLRIQLFTEIKRLNNTKSVVCVAVTAAYRTTLTAAVYIVLKLLPLDINTRNCKYNSAPFMLPNLDPGGGRQDATSTTCAA